MMRINLLPVRAAKKQISARQELLVLAGITAISLALLFVWWTVFEAQTGTVGDSVAALKSQIEEVKRDVKRVEQFKVKAELAERKLSIIQRLKDSKVGPARMLDDIATILDEQKKTWLTRLEEKDGVLVLEGGSMEHESISEFQVALARISGRFRNIKLNVVNTKNESGATYLEWKITCNTRYTAG